MLLQVFSETKDRRETFDANLDLSCNCAYDWPILMSISTNSSFFWTKNNLQAVR